MSWGTGFVSTYRANRLSVIHCMDKNGQPFDLPTGPSIATITKVEVQNGGKRMRYGN